MAEMKVEILAEHYQKAFEISYETWKQRNKVFSWLLGLVSIAVLLTFQVPQANPLLVDWIAKFVGVTDPTRIAEIRNGFPFALLHSALGVVIFYAMVNVYQHNRIIEQNNSYLPRLERELRDQLGLGRESVFFTRESSYNTGEQFNDGLLIAWTYVISLGLLLTAFVGGRLVEDIILKNPPLLFVDLVLSTLILRYFMLYARLSVGSGKRKAKTPKTFEDFQAEINSIFKFAKMKRLSGIVINAGELHILVGDYPGKDHRMPVCCNAMRKMMRDGDEVLSEPSSGAGATLTIRYQVMDTAYGGKL